MNFTKKNHEHPKVNKNWVSKNIILFFCLLLTTSLAFSQSKGTDKTGVTLQKKLQSTPVGFIKEGTPVVNLTTLNPRTCLGEKIISFKIAKHKKINLFFLVRQAKLKNGFLTTFIPLKVSGGKFYVMQNAESYMTGCYSTTCESCGEALSQTGMAFCECESNGGDCEEYDHCPDSEVLSTLFN